METLWYTQLMIPQEFPRGTEVQSLRPRQNRRFSQDDQKAPLCVTVPLLMIWKEVVSRTHTKKAYIPPIRYHMKPKRTNSLRVSNSLFLFQLWAIFTARFSWAENLGRDWMEQAAHLVDQFSLCLCTLGWVCLYLKIRWNPLGTDCATNSILKQYLWSLGWLPSPSTLLKKLSTGPAPWRYLPD